MKSFWVWPIKIFFLSIALSMLFGMLSEMFMQDAGLFISLIVVIVFVIISIITDILSSAVLACDENYFKQKEKENVEGAWQGLYFVKNAPRFTSLCADVIGDICGILSGAGGASILYIVITHPTTTAIEIIVSSLISAIIAGITIFGKAIFKHYAIKNANRIILHFGKVVNFFIKKPK